MTDLHRTATIRRVEREWIARLGGGVLMTRAAEAVADAAARIARTLPRGAPILALVGPGNNGGDALQAAALLRERGFPADALALSPDAPTADDARAVYDAWIAAGRPIAPLATLAERLAAQTPTLVIDGLFGIGLARPLEGDAANAAAILAATPSATVLAVDVPSGIDADTGAIVGGPGAVAIRAAVTVTMLGDKPGLHTGVALDHVGRVEVASLGVPAAPADGVLFDAAQACARLRPRARDSHKGRHGSVLVIGGAEGTRGAALLAALGAQAAGAGKVFVAGPDGPVFDPGQPQLMTRSLDSAFDDLDAICIGCGLGRSRRARAALNQVLARPLPLAIDADALNLLAEDAELAAQFAERGAPIVLTPHPLEAARMLGLSSAQVQADRIASAIALASRHDVVALLKGAGSVVAAPDSSFSINTSGGSALATAGTGDVLAGVVSALLAQGLSAADAARVGAWAHGAAGDLWQVEHPTGAGLSAARLPEFVTRALQFR